MEGVHVVGAWRMEIPSGVRGKAQVGDLGTKSPRIWRKM